MAITLNETVVKDVVARLDADLAGHVTAINTAAATAADGFTIEEPQQVLDHVPSLAELTAFPTVGIGDGNSTFEDDLGHSATGVHDVLVMVYLQHPDRQTLTWQLRRYEQAIVRTVLAGRRLDTPGNWGTGLRRIVPGPMLEDEPNPDTPHRRAQITSWAGLLFWAKREEE